MNMLFDEFLGEAVSRRGTSIIGAQMDGGGDPCLGLYQHIDTTFANSKLFAGFGTSIYDVVNGDAEVTGLTASAKQRYETFMNATLMTNGVEARSYTHAGGWISTGGAFDLDNLPTGGQFPTEFKDRMYVAVNDTLHYSTASDGSAIDWTADGSGTLLVESEDGGGTIQGLAKVPKFLMIYKERSLKRWDFDSTYPEDLVNIGTQSHESIVTARGKNYFFYGPNGFYETNGSFPKRISRPVQRFIDAIPSSFYENINGWSDNQHVYWSVGDLTVDFDRGYTESYTNVVLRFTIDTEQWAALQYAHEFRRLGQYISGTDVLIIGGNTDGHVLRLNNGNTDYGGAAIRSILQSPEFDFQRREFKKRINSKIIVHADGLNGGQLQARLDYGQWAQIGSIKGFVSQVDLSRSLQANVFEFRVVESTSGLPVRIRGLDFPSIEILDDTKPTSPTRQ